MTDLPLATAAELTETFRHALRFRFRGKALGMRAREDDAALAANIAEAIVGSGFRVLKESPAPGFSTGTYWPRDGP